VGSDPGSTSPTSDSLDVFDYCSRCITHQETEAFIKKLMRDKGLPIPPDITGSTRGLNGCQYLLRRQ